VTQNLAHPVIETEHIRRNGELLDGRFKEVLPNLVVIAHGVWS
jgi:hypothetical protein